MWHLSHAHAREYDQEATPHCAEGSDITNIVIEREDYIMLSRETKGRETTF